MTAADATFKRYDPWYVKVAFGLFVTFEREGFLAILHSAPNYIVQWAVAPRLRTRCGRGGCQCPHRFKPYRPLRRKVAIRRDGEDFVIAFQPEDIVVFRHAEATALRRACVVLRWEVVSDTVAEASNPASW